MPLGKFWRWCPKCKGKSVRYMKLGGEGKTKPFLCSRCNKRFTSEEIKNA